MAQEATHPSVPGYPKRAYTVISATIGGVIVLVMLLEFMKGYGLYMTSGVWAALAGDAAHGVFYRPVFADDGYGGTRYMPAHFLLNAAILSIIKHPVVAARIAVLFAGVVLLAGLYRLLRAFNLPSHLAAASSFIAFGSIAIQYALISTRGDLLAAALNVWGIALVAALSTKPSRMVMIAASICFALAFMTKFTTLFGLAASVVYIAANGRRRDAATLTSITSSLIVILLVAVHIFSRGRALESFLACASGGITPIDFLLSPFRFLYAARVDPPFLVFFVFGLVALFARRKPLSDLPSALFIFTTIATVIIMASPGTDISHFIDLQVASVVITAVHVNQSARSRLLQWALPCGGVFGAAILVMAVAVMMFTRPDSRWEEQRRIMASVGEGGAPMLADDPWVPILAGERPFILDNFAIRTMNERRPEVLQDLYAKLDAHFFRAAVLDLPKHLRDDERATNGTWRGKRWYGDVFYGPDFEERLLNAYEPVAFIGDYIVLVPK